MTTEQIRNRDWLSRAYRMEQKLCALREKCIIYRERAERTRSTLSSVGSGKNDSRRNVTKESLEALLQSSEEYRQCEGTYKTVRCEVESAIGTLLDPDVQTVMIYRYLGFLSMNRISQILDCDRSTIYRRHSRGLKEITIPEGKESSQ